jgi:hypothetical protein
LTGITVCFRNNPSGVTVNGLELSNNAGKQQSLGSNELNQASYCWVSVSNCAGEIATCFGRRGKIAELLHLRYLRKLETKTGDGFRSSCLDSQSGGGHGFALKNQGLPILCWTWAEKHLSLMSAKVRDGFRLEHQIHRGSITAKGLGEHIGKDRRKAVITISHGLAMELVHFGVGNMP